MAEIKVLIEGVNEKIGEDKLKVGSTVALIKTDKIILVDTGSFLDGGKLINELKKEDLTPEKIDIVVLTHIHLDHIINTHLFQNAKIICKFRSGLYPGQIHYPKDGCLQRFEIKDGVKIAEDVKLILTPGHTDDMISVVVDTNEGKMVIAGDAISNESWADLNKTADPILVTSIEEFNESRKKILNLADYIIPGHGKMFKVNK
jgi:glyoxylase-like metal-dependent hydrolase (beta-lactamase superfamily II)